jgi:hypothetical protein
MFKEIDLQVHLLDCKGKSCSSSSWHVLGLEACYGLQFSLHFLIGRPIDLFREVHIVKLLLEIFQEKKGKSYYSPILCGIVVFDFLMLL